MKVFIIEDELKQAPRNSILEALLSIKAKVTYALSAEEAKAKFKPPYDLILLDHDMRGFYESSDVPHSGYQFLKWSVEGGFWSSDWAPISRVIIHSQNGPGAKKMQALLRQYGVKAEAKPFN